MLNGTNDIVTHKSQYYHYLARPFLFCRVYTLCFIRVVNGNGRNCLLHAL